jgi:hypothetical protein
MARRPHAMPRPRLLGRRRAAQGLLVGTLFAVAPGSAQAQISAPSPTPEGVDPLYPQALPLDNPVFTGILGLGEYQECWREAGMASEERAWLFHNFKIMIDVEPPPDTVGAKPLDTSRVWPSQPGEFYAYNDVPWEMHGAKLGHYESTVTAEVTFNPFSTEAQSTTWALASTSELLPVQVVVVRPDYSASEVSAAMDRITPNSQFALWDDTWGNNDPQISNDPSGGGPATVRGRWETWTELTRETEGRYARVQSDPPTLDYVRPDDVFAQCGVQFRLVDWLEITHDETHVEFVKDGAGVCDDAERRLLLREIVHRAELTPHNDLLAIELDGIRSSLITVVYNYRSIGADCGAAPDGGALVDGTDVLIGVADNAGPNSDLTLSHHLGHVLGLEHPDDTQAYCGQGTPGEADNLMCPVGEHTNTHIFGCDDWWTWTLGYAYNCNADPAETAQGGDCLTVRDVAKSLAESGWAEIESTDGCDGVDNDLDGEVDENCLFRFLLIPFCYTGDDEQFRADADRQLDFFLASLGLDVCPENIYREYVPQDVLELPTASGQGCSNSHSQSGLPGQYLEAYADAGAPDPDNFTLSAAITNDLAVCSLWIGGQAWGTDFVWAKLYPDGARSQTQRPINTQSMLAHEIGHLTGFDEEGCHVSYTDSDFCNQADSINLLEARLGCDPTVASCCDPSSGRCLGNVPAGGGRCIMADATAGAEPDDPSPPRHAWCENCWNHLKQNDPTSGQPKAILLAALDCASAYPGNGPILDINAQTDSTGDMSDVRPRFVESGRMPLALSRPTGKFRLRILDSAGQSLYETAFDVGPEVRLVGDAPLPPSPTEGEFRARVPLPEGVSFDEAMPVEVFDTSENLTSRVTLNGEPPVAEAGPDQTVECDQAAAGTVVLDADGSSDPDGDTLAFSWCGSGVTFDDPSSAAPTATVSIGTSELQLDVSDGLYSDEDGVAITVVDSTSPEICGFRYCGHRCLSPPKDKYVVLRVGRDFKARMWDLCDSEPELVVSSVEGSDASDGSDAGDDNDNVVVFPDRVCLRVDQDGRRWRGDRYTVSLVARDSSGNESEPEELQVRLARQCHPGHPKPWRWHGLWPWSSHHQGQCGEHAAGHGHQPDQGERSECGGSHDEREDQMGHFEDSGPTDDEADAHMSTGAHGWNGPEDWDGACDEHHHGRHHCACGWGRGHWHHGCPKHWWPEIVDADDPVCDPNADPDGSAGSGADSSDGHHGDGNGLLCSASGGSRRGGPAVLVLLPLALTVLRRRKRRLSQSARAMCQC